MLSETQLRGMARERTLPVYPDDAKQNRVGGVVVVQLHLSENNIIDWIKVLEAPNRSIAEASKLAVSKWRFPASGVNDTKICMTAKLTFYFVIEGDKAFVKNPRRYDYKLVGKND